MPSSRVKGSTFAFVVQRAVSSLLVLAGATPLVFVVVRAVFGDPVASMLGEQALPIDKAALRACMRINQPL